MKTTMKTLALGCIVGSGLLCVPAHSAAMAINPQDYPKLSEKELGHIRHLVKMSHQLPGDWSGFGSQFLVTERTTQFQVAFAGMTLALAQHQATPAYKELYQSAIQAYITKLQHPDIWERWMLSSRGGARGGLLTDVAQGWLDPIAKDNIMLKAYLLQLGAAHDMLYGDKMYDKPGAFTYFYHGQGLGNGLITFRYTLGDIAENIHQEVVDSNYVGSACEPGRIFWSCNAPSSVAFMHFDHLHGTRYADVMPKMKSAWIEKGYIDPSTYKASEVVYTSWADRSAEQEGTPASAMVGNGWAGMFNHAWDPEFVEQAYYGPDRKDRNETLQFMLSGEYSKVPEIIDHPGQAVSSIMWGLFISYAAEVGDRDAVDKMLAYADRNFGPVWENGEYYYPRNDDYSVDAQGNSHGVDPWIGNILIPLARLNKGSGFLKLYNEPWSAKEYGQPYISDVDTSAAGVSQAFYDDKKDALIVTLLPGPIKAKETSFVVRQLDPKKRYAVIKDGKEIGELQKSGSAKVPAVAWREDGTVHVSTAIAAPHTFLFVAR